MEDIAELSMLSALCLTINPLPKLSENIFQIEDVNTLLWILLSSFHTDNAQIPQYTSS